MRNRAENFILLASLCFSFIALSEYGIGQSLKRERESEVPIRVKYDVVYGRNDEPMHRADIYQPSVKIEGQLRPGVILVHGGAWIAGDKSNDVLHAKRMARLGFVVMSINYRLAPAHPFPAQIDDCYLALDWFGKQSTDLRLDLDSLGGWGYSAGGHLIALVATHPKELRLKACVVGGAPCDLTQIPENSQMLARLLGGTRSQYPERYSDASPVTHVSSDDPPIFLFHGEKDLLVPPNSSIVMRDALEKNHVPFEYWVVPNKAHLMTFIDKEATEKSFAFLKEQLGKNR